MDQKIVFLSFFFFFFFKHRIKKLIFGQKGLNIGI
jgi:hypothetical protein